EEGQEKPCQLKLWDVATAKERATIALPEFDGMLDMLSIPLVFTADGKTLITAGWIFEKDKETKERMWHDSYYVGRVSVQHWDLATGKARATFWTPVNPGGTHEFSGNVVGMYFAALSADGKTVAWGGAEGEGEKKNIGTAHVWEVESLATSPPEIPKEIMEAEEAKQAAKKPVPKILEREEGTFSLRMPALPTFIKPGEKKTVTIGIKRGKNFDQDVTLTFADIDVPKGVTFEPANRVSTHPSPEATFTIQSAKDAAVGNFAIKVVGRACASLGVSKYPNFDY